MVGSVGDYTYRRTKYGTIVTEKIQKGRKMPSLVFLEGGFWTRLPSSREQDRGRRREGLALPLGGRGGTACRGQGRGWLCRPGAGRRWEPQGRRGRRLSFFMWLGDLSMFFLGKLPRTVPGQLSEKAFRFRVHWAYLMRFIAVWRVTRRNVPSSASFKVSSSRMRSSEISAHTFACLL